jgi:ElaB/YqjD/DUF883 family membrane-anchored ribosome-binding protein
MDVEHKFSREGSVMEENEKSSLLEEAVPVVESLTEGEGKVSRFKTEASQVVENGMTAARRLARRGRAATENLIDGAAHHIQDEPLRSIAMGLAIGFGVGALAVWIATHHSRE